MTAAPTPAQARLVFLLVVCGTVLAIGGTDLVLPAVPGLPAALGGTAAQAQLVLAAYVAGAGVGLLLFGELGARHDQRTLLALAMALFAVTSLAAAFVRSIETLVVVRFVQGAVGSAASVFAPGVIKALYPPDKAVRAIGLFGSIEGLVPALAPIVGAWLVSVADWRASFFVLAALACALAVSLLRVRRDLLAGVATARTGSYLALLRNGRFMRLALSHAFSLGGLLVFVFGAPAVFVLALGGTLADFVVMQVAGITCFIIGANATGHIVARTGASAMIVGGSALLAIAACAILAYALAGGRNPRVVAALFVPLNFGMGLRGPPGFFQAVVASEGDDSRGAGLVILFILATTAIGTAIVAPWIREGLVPLALVAAVIASASVVVLVLPQRLAARAPSG